MKWIPLECNPEVFTEWAENAGLVTALDQFADVYGLDPELLDMVPKPAKAILLLFPANGKIEETRLAADKKIKEEGQHPVDPTLVFITQTISNACGTIGLLHALLNTDVTTRPQSAISNYRTKCLEITPDERGKLLETTDDFTSIHTAAAHQGQTAAPSADDDTDLHFTCFIQALSPAETEDGRIRLVELDGRRGGPIDHGPSDDLLTDASKVIRKNFVSLTEDLKFSMLALAAPSPYN